MLPRCTSTSRSHSRCRRGSYSRTRHTSSWSSRALRAAASATATLVMCRSFFFFSSRRRHTRYWRDWSSDVCSSDLPAVKTQEELYRRVWGLGAAGIEVPLKILHGADMREIKLRSIDRFQYFKEKPEIGRASCRERV